VPDLALDSMHWEVNTYVAEFGTHRTSLYMGGRITSTREVPLWGIGVLFETQRDSQIAYRRLVNDFSIMRPVPGFEQNAATVVQLHRVLPERPVPVWASENNAGTQPPPGWGCPLRARLVREMDLATHIGLVERVASDSGNLLAARRVSRGGALDAVEILADTLVDLWPWDGTLVGVAANTTERTLRNVAVWVAIDRPTNSGGSDTLAFTLGDMPPHALVSFGGGRLSLRDPRVARGAWVGEQPGPRVTAAHRNSVRVYRGARNGEIFPSVIARDEQQSSEFYDGSPATFDVADALARGRYVVGLVHGASAAAERADLLIVQSKILYRRRSGGVIWADSARLSSADMDSLHAGERALGNAGMPGLSPDGQVAAEDSVLAGIRPRDGEDVLVMKSPIGPIRRLRFPAGAPPKVAKPLFAVLSRLEQQLAARPSSSRGGH
jgi:hypothetical protein